MDVVYAFVLWDYIVFALMLLVSAVVGIYCALTGRGRQSSQDFLVGGRSMMAPPVAMSLTASFMSAITMLGTPVEVYRYGAIFGLYVISFLLVMVVTSEVFLPVFYRLGVNSTNEYLEMRFSRATRLCGTVMFILQTVLYTGLVIYVPALALNQVTGFDLWGAVLSTGLVCTFYCTMGGLKAVVWTDVLQMAIMVAGFLSIIVRAVGLQGGILPIINDSERGGRLNFWNFDPNPLKRYTFWTVVVGGSFIWTGIYGVNQSQVQRYISCKSLGHARASLYLNLLGLWVIIICATFCGLCLYSIYQYCDPWTAGLVSAPDQLLPYLVLEILKDYPGVPGLFVAAVYSGTLSTVSSSINSLTTVTVEDLIKPHFSMSDKTLSWISKGLSFAYGAVCIGLTGIASLMGGIMEAALSFLGVIGGPLLGLFSLGILCPFANSTGGIVGLYSGLGLSLWLGIALQLNPSSEYYMQPLNLTTAGCNLTKNEASLNWITTTEQPPLSPSVSVADKERSMGPDSQGYFMSYLYVSPIGTLVTMLVGIIVSLLTGRVKVSPGLTLIKEDFSCYSIYLTLKQKIQDFSQELKRSGKLDHKVQSETQFGRQNPAFLSSEVDLSHVQVESKDSTVYL